MALPTIPVHLGLGATVETLPEFDGETRTVTLEVGQAVVDPPGVWHTADVEVSATAVFVTAGRGTEIRER